MKLRGFLFFIFFTEITFSLAFAERVRTVRKDGILELDTGAKVQLAGLEIPPETGPLLVVLLAGKDVQLEKESLPASAPENEAHLVYLYVKTSEVELPSKTGFDPKEKKVMVNQLLIAMGAARVDESLTFKWKERFAKIQAIAREKGEGIWSYAQAHESF